jgi:hypothetical protein
LVPTDIVVSAFTGWFADMTVPMIPADDNAIRPRAFLRLSSKLVVISSGSVVDDDNDDEVVERDESACDERWRP